MEINLIFVTWGLFIALTIMCYFALWAIKGWHDALQDHKDTLERMKKHLEFDKKIS